MPRSLINSLRQGLNELFKVLNTEADERLQVVWAELEKERTTLQKNYRKMQKQLASLNTYAMARGDEMKVLKEKFSHSEGELSDELSREGGHTSGGFDDQ